MANIPVMKYNKRKIRIFLDQNFVFLIKASHYHKYDKFLELIVKIFCKSNDKEEILEFKEEISNAIEKEDKKTVTEELPESLTLTGV